MATPVYTDTTGRKITQTAYDTQAKAGTDVSKYTKIWTAPVVNTQPVQQPANDVLSKIKELPQYQDLLGKWYTEEQIDTAVWQYKPKQTSETQVQPSTEVQPATSETPAEQTTATPTETTPTEQKKDTTAPDLLPVSDYMDDSEARQQWIVSNLNWAVQTNPQSLKDQTSFRDYYNYAGRSDLQKKTLDTWYQWYTKGNELSYKDTKEIYKQYDNWVLTTSDLSNLNIVNPTKYAEVKALIDKKNTMATYAEDLYGAEATANPFQSIIDNYTKWLQTLATSNFYNDYKEAMNSAGIKEQKLAIADKQTEIDKIDKQINEKKKEIEKRYEWKGATAGKIWAIVADETEDLYSMRSNLTIDMNGAIGKYNAEAWAIKEDFEMKQAEQQYNMQVKQQQMSELGFAMNLMSYETPAQQDERAWNTFIRQQEYTDGNIYSSDPKTRLKAIEKAVDNTLKEFDGIPMVRSRYEMVNDIKNIVEQGGDLGDAITENIRKPVMNKPEYRLWSANKLWVSESALQLAGMNLWFDANGNITLNQSISSSTYGKTTATWNFNPNLETYYKNYWNGKAPSSTDYKAMKLTLEQFTAQATSWKNSKWYTYETTAQQEEITKLRKEVNNLPQVKEYKTVKNMYQTVQNSANLWTAAWDLSLIFSYMKILDPNSTVREWEFANAQNAWGIQDKIRNAYNKAMKGTRLSDRQRTDFSNTSKTLYKWYEKTYNDVLNEYKTYSVLWGDVSRLWTETTQQTITTPSVNYFSQFQSWVGNITTIPSYFNYIIGN